MTELFTEMMKLPLTTFAYGLEMLIKTMQGIQKIADQSMGVMIDEHAQKPEGVPERKEVLTSSQAANHHVIEDSFQPIHKEGKPMRDADLNNDLVKLVQYSIVSIARGDERVLDQNKEVLFSDRMTEDGFTAWRVAEFIRTHPKKICSRDAKHLRVYYQVLDSWPQEELHYEERQLDVLGEIRDAIEKKRTSNDDSTSGN